MEQLFVVILAFLVLLAAFDLFVGVSNDAVNFLNSAIGSRVASFRTIMLVASAGVLIGATFSSGMMEIAKSGVFNPEMFTFQDIILVFFSVMVADILLLDTFNSLGLPTSTTVSIVFELLGGAVSTALIKLWSSGQSITLLGQYINSDKAIAIVSGILVSVVVAFIGGMVVQYVCRLIFTFHFEKMYRKIGGVFGGIALTSIFYFLVMKGAKGASFMRKEYLAWINANTGIILLVVFCILTIVLHFLLKKYRVNIFKIVILAGTFSLAFAFAGNDLVNFVGVPLAAYESYIHYTTSGVAASIFTMEGLRQAVQTPTLYLLLSGVIMVLTLWFSKKAHRVVQTSINLSSSAGGENEQFNASFPGRVIVRSGLALGKVLDQIIPGSVRRGIDSRMEKVPPKPGEVPLPFDQVRASINLIVASILIASATSLKLPLSTTYVTFMVAMGSSFADGAWDRESAVYRISGVITVVCGWFLTAFCAFTLCAIVNSIVNSGGEIAVICVMVLAAAVLIKSNFFNKDVEQSSVGILTDEKEDPEAIRASIRQAIISNVETTASHFDTMLNAFFDEDIRTLKKVKNQAAGHYEDLAKWRNEYYSLALVDASSAGVYDEVRYTYYSVFTSMKDIGERLQNLTRSVEAHVSNRHRIYTDDLRTNLLALNNELKQLQRTLSGFMENSIDSKAVLESSNASLHRIGTFQMTLLNTIEREHISLRSSELYMSLLRFVYETVNRYTMVTLNQARQAAEAHAVRVEA